MRNRFHAKRIKDSLLNNFVINSSANPTDFLWQDIKIKKIALCAASLISPVFFLFIYSLKYKIYTFLLNYIKIKGFNYFSWLL